MTIAAFQAAVEQATGVPAALQELRGGFPPKPLARPADGDADIAGLGIAAGDSITVTQAAGPPPPAAAAATEAVAPAAAAVAVAEQPGSSNGFSLEGLSEDEQLARAIAASLGQDFPPPAAAPATASPPAAPARPGGSSGGAGASAVMIAEAVLGDPVEWNEAVLQKEPAAYAAWICGKSTWGGAIELSILALGKEIAAFDTQTQRADVYGSGQGFGDRVLLIYDGLHYDALAVAAFEGAPEELDVTAIPSSGSQTDAVMQAAAALVAQAHAARQFTDTANFTLRCGVCKQGLRGEKEAVAHARATGHQQFTEY
eukprot:scaffold2.g7280.t1